MKSSARLLHDEKKKGLEKMKVIDSDDILKEQYELLRSSRKIYKRLKVQLVAVNHQWQMDLADLKCLKRFNSVLRYLLVVIDVYSHYLGVIKLLKLFIRNSLKS